jgi:hypothetical protein
MPRLYLPLVPVAVLAAIVAASACSKRHAEEGDTLRVVPPPAAAYAAEPSPADAAAVPKPLLASASGGAKAKGADPAPTAEEVKAFEAPVAK